MANILIKRKTGATSYENLFASSKVEIITDSVGTPLQTLLDNKINTSARGTANGVASLDGNTKIPIAQLPDAIFDSLYFFTTTSGTVALSTLAGAAFTNAASISRNALGYYWVCSAATTIQANSTSQQVGSLYFITNINPAEEGVSTSTGSVTLEAGDWVVISKVTGSGTSGTPYTITFAVVNNTYELATTTTQGIVQLSGDTLTTQLTGNQVITETVLGNLVVADGTDIFNGGIPISGKIAPARHLHTDLQPLDGTLTALAGVSTSADKLIYATGPDAFTTTNLTAFGRSLIDDADATAARATIGTYSTSQVDALVSQRALIYYDLSKALADTEDVVIGAYIFDDLSTSNGW
jgi:hypothetical protein